MVTPDIEEISCAPVATGFSHSVSYPFANLTSAGTVPELSADSEPMLGHYPPLKNAGALAR